MTDLPSMPLYVDDYEADTAHLTPEEDGIYNRLLRLCWRSPGCEVPDNAAWLARKLRVDQCVWERSCVPVIDEFFTRKDSKLFQKRQREEFSYVTRMIKARKAAGAKGGKAKSRKAKETYSSNATDLPEENEKQTDAVALAPTPTPTPTIKKEEEDARENLEFSKGPASPPGLLADVREALGVVGVPGAYWTDTALQAHVTAWREGGLTDDQIITEARASRAKNPEPPDGPKALDRWMASAATAKRNAPLPGQGRAVQKAETKPPSTPFDRLKYFADWVNGSKSMPPSVISNTLAQSLLDAGLVTRDRLKQRGVYA